MKEASLRKVSKTNPFLIRVKDGVHILHEHITDHPESWMANVSEKQAMDIELRYVQIPEPTATPATQSFDPASTGPRLNVFGEIANFFPPKLMLV